jgi:hypothetical protein
MGAPRLMDQVRDVLCIHHYSLRDLPPKIHATVDFVSSLRQ